MTPADLNVAHSAVIRRHWRALNDSGGIPGRGLLDDLAQVAAQHADDVGVIAVRREDDLPPETEKPLIAPGAVDRKGPIRTGTRRGTAK